MTARCECCDLPVESCGKAVELRQRDEAAARRRALIATRRYFPSQYAGRCSSCHERYAAGALITPQLVDGERRWVSECCADEAVTGGAA